MSPGSIDDLDAHVDPDEIIDLTPNRYLLDEDIASEQVAGLISSMTGNEVDGDGSPWEVVLSHLAGVADAVKAIKERHPDAGAWLADEFGWSLS